MTEWAPGHQLSDSRTGRFDNTTHGLYHPAVEGKDLVQLLKKHGWTEAHVRGSHHVLSKGGQHLSVPVHARKELGKGLLHELLKRAGLK